MILGIDTSNYTTSCALYDYINNRIIHKKKLLPVSEGEKGLRQSDAVFEHIKQLGTLISDLFCEAGNPKIEGVAVSTRPRDIDGSYMPCFLVGETIAQSIASSLNVPFYRFSHQQGHIAAALYSADRLDLLSHNFIAFHLSGGTTEALLVNPDNERIIKCTKVSESLDLKAGQAIDRVGVMMGLEFPSGKHLEKLALDSNKNYKIKPTLKGNDCCLSGIENQCKKMFDSKEPCEDISLYCIKSIESALCEMTNRLIDNYGKMPLVYAGGVMSNSIIRKTMEDKFDGIFASPEFSSDNAAGIAILGSICFQK